LEEAARVFFGEGVHLQRTGEVGTEGHHTLIARAEFEEAGAETAAGVLLVEDGVSAHGREGSEGAR